MLAIGALLLAVLAIACIWLVCFKLTTRRYLAQGLRSIGVATKRVWRTVKELRRKSFHLLGVLFPTLYWFGLQAGILTRASASVIVCAIVCINFLIEILRKVSPQFAHFYETKLAKGILRAKERNRVTGMLFFSLGVFLSITFFPVRISIAAILFLVCGDLAAAMVGVSFGRTKIVGKKSLEGFLAMFVVCFVIAFVIFKDQYLVEYVAFVGALCASLVELLEPLGIDDNFMIPLTSCLALYLASVRTGNVDYFAEHRGNPLLVFVGFSD